MAEKGEGEGGKYKEGIDGKWIKFKNPFTGRVQDKFELFPEEERIRRAEEWKARQKEAKERIGRAKWIRGRIKETVPMKGAKDD